MKKVLLIIAITLCIFQMVVLAVAIDIGETASNRSGYSTPNYTKVNKGNPANDTGTITSVEIWAYTDLSNVEVAIFYEGAANVLSTRDTHSIGSVTAGSKQTFNVNLDVQVGDYIGMYWTTGSIEYSSSGCGGQWIANGDNIPCTDITFSLFEGDAISLYGTGTTAAGEEANAIFFGMAF